MHVKKKYVKVMKISPWIKSLNVGSHRSDVSKLIGSGLKYMSMSD
jgi:hypothetical protein